MKIDSHHPLPRPGQTEPRDDTRKVEHTDSPSRNAEPASSTRLSLGATDTRQDIDTARVEEIREAIREGRLAIHAERIADGLIVNAQDLLGETGQHE